MKFVCPICGNLLKIEITEKYSLIECKNCGFFLSGRNALKFIEEAKSKSEYFLFKD